jgi:hypothetical protein
MALSVYKESLSGLIWKIGLATFVFLLMTFVSKIAGENLGIPTFPCMGVLCAFLAIMLLTFKHLSPPLAIKTLQDVENLQKEVADNEQVIISLKANIADFEQVNNKGYDKVADLNQVINTYKSFAEDLQENVGTEKQVFSKYKHTEIEGIKIISAYLLPIINTIKDLEDKEKKHQDLYNRLAQEKEVMKPAFKFMQFIIRENLSGDGEELVAMLQSNDNSKIRAAINTIAKSLNAKSK